ncbi:MAG TPA: hypothetical protein DEP79_08930 [Gammaproteobacteria bacterium]|nr:hypothetical protein [Gammaproteobacteria bacterium]
MKMNRGLLVLIPAVVLLSACEQAGEFPDSEGQCSFDSLRESERAASAASFGTPEITSMAVNGSVVWDKAAPPATPPSLQPGNVVTLSGTNLGNGPDTDFTKIMIGNTRVLETDLVMYKQKLDIADQVNFEVDDLLDSWPKDILNWQPNQIQFTVPGHVSSGPLTVQIQKRTGYNESLTEPGQPYNVIDAQTSRITDENFEHKCDVVSELSASKATSPIAVSIVNPEFRELVRYGEEIFWSYDYNIGLAHAIRNLSWDKIFNYETIDPITGEVADPAKLFGAYPTVSGEVPTAAIEDVYFEQYPQPSPIPGFLTVEPQLTRGNTRDSGWVGYRYAQSSHPYVGRGSWIGFNCASCHGYRISYDKAPGTTVTKVFPGLPNPEWTVKWSVLGDRNAETTSTFDGIVTSEEGPSWDPGAQKIDKSMLLYHLPQGTGEHNMIRVNGEGSSTDNDYQFSPHTIPNVTNYMSIRRSLSHTESYVGFEGSYIHAEEPDGATGSMYRYPLQALTAYMTVLDQDDADLRNVGLYRWLRYNGKLAAQTGNENLSEGEFVQNGWAAYPGVVAAVNQGSSSFASACGSCHQDNLGAHTNENMLPLNEVGHFFAPSVYQQKTQSVRVGFLRNMYWVQHRGLLTDGHIRNLEDLLHPDRCNSGTELYNQYYTLHPPVVPALGGPDFPEPYPAINRKGDVFRVPKSQSTAAGDTAAQRNTFIERHKYFVEVPWDTEHYYWDYQTFRAQYGPDELGTPAPIGMPAAPHPWCANSASEVSNMVQYILTL